MEPLLSRRRQFSGFSKGIFRSRTSSSRRFRFRDLPHETVLLILGEFFLLRTYSDLPSSYDVLEFYGYFLKDYDRNINLIFKSVCASRKYELYYIPCLELQYFEFNNITTLTEEGDDMVLYSGGDEFVFPIKYFELCDYIEQLVNVHLTTTILKYVRDRFCDRLKRLDFYIKVVNNDVLDLLNELTFLTRLKITCTQRMDFTPYLDSPKRTGFADQRSSSFHNLRPAQVRKQIQKKKEEEVTPSPQRRDRHRHHHQYIFSSSPDELDERYLTSKEQQAEENRSAEVVPKRRDLMVPNLRHLEIHRYISKFLFMSNPFSVMPNLRTLRFCHISKLTNSQIRVIIDHSSQKLENLYFEKVYLEDDFINILSMRNLRSLSFKNCTYNYNLISKNFRFDKDKKKKKKKSRKVMKLLNKKNKNRKTTSKKSPKNNISKKKKGIVRKRNKKSVILSFSDSSDSSSDSSDSESSSDEDSSDDDEDSEEEEEGEEGEGEEDHSEEQQEAEKKQQQQPKLRYFEFEYYCGEIFKNKYRTIRKNLQDLKRTYSFKLTNNNNNNDNNINDQNNRLIEGLDERSLDLSFLRNALIYFKTLSKLRLINCNLSKKHFDVVRNFGFKGMNILIQKRHMSLHAEDSSKVYEFYKQK